MDKRKHYYLNAAELMDTVFDIYKKSFFKQLGLSVIFNIIFSTIAGILIFAGIVGFMVSIIGFDFDQMSPAVVAMVVVGFIGLIVLYYSLKYGATSTGNIIISKETFDGESSNMGDIMKACFKKMLPVATVIFAEIIFILPFLVIIGLLMVGYVYLLSNLSFFDVSYMYGFNPTQFEIAIVIISFFLLVIIIMALMILYSTLTIMTIPIAILERKLFFSAVVRSIRLVRKDFLKLMGIVAIWYIIVEAIGYAVLTLSGLGGSLAAVFTPYYYRSLLSLASFYTDIFIMNLVNALLAPLSGIFATVIYINQRIKYEGYDIELSLNQLIKKRKMEEMAAQRGIYLNQPTPGGPR